MRRVRMCVKMYVNVDVPVVQDCEYLKRWCQLTAIIYHFQYFTMTTIIFLPNYLILWIFFYFIFLIFFFFLFSSLDSLHATAPSPRFASFVFLSSPFFVYQAQSQANAFSGSEIVWLLIYQENVWKHSSLRSCKMPLRDVYSMERRRTLNRRQTNGISRKEKKNAVERFGGAKLMAKLHNKPRRIP